jgi:hypothetical protein
MIRDIGCGHQPLKYLDDFENNGKIVFRTYIPVLGKSLFWGFL